MLTITFNKFNSDVVRSSIKPKTELVSDKAWVVRDHENRDWAFSSIGQQVGMSVPDLSGDYDMLRSVVKALRSVGAKPSGSKVKLSKKEGLMEVLEILYN